MIRTMKLNQVVALIGLFGIATVSQAQLVNPSFEDGTGADASNWFRFGNAYREPAGARTGNFSMKMFGNFNGGTNVTGAFQDFAIAPGQTASASVYGLNMSTDAMSGDNFAVLKLIYRDAGNNDIAFQESAVRITRNTTQDQFQLMTASLGAAPANTDHGSLFLLFVQLDTTPFAGGATFFDDAQVSVVPEPGTMIALGAGVIALVRSRRKRS